MYPSRNARVGAAIPMIRYRTSILHDGRWLEVAIAPKAQQLKA
jgi:hypothetical protein